MASGAGLTVRRLVAGRGAWPRVAAYNGAMGCPKRGRVLEASRPALRACNRQFYGEVRVLGSQMGLPRFNLRQVSEDPGWDAAWTEPAFKAPRDPSGRQMTKKYPLLLFRAAQITLRCVSYNRCAQNAKP